MADLIALKAFKHPLERRPVAIGEAVTIPARYLHLYKSLGLVAVQARSPLDHDGDGKAGGSKRGAASTRAKGVAKSKTGGRVRRK